MLRHGQKEGFTLHSRLLRSNRGTGMKNTALKDALAELLGRWWRTPLNIFSIDVEFPDLQQGKVRMIVLKTARTAEVN
jgi:hypothetical protein